MPPRWLNKLVDFFVPRKTGIPGVTWGGPGAETWEYAQTWVRGMMGQNQKTLVEPYAQHSTTALAIEMRAEDTAAIDWKLYRKENGEITDEVVKDHPIINVLRRPNEYLLGKSWFVATYIFDLLEGEAFWYYPDLVLPRKNTPDSAANIAGGKIFLLPPWDVVSKLTDSGVDWFLRDAGGRERPLQADRLTHFKRFNPYKMVRGLAKISAIRTEVEGDFSAANWNQQFFGEQNGIPAGLLVPGVESEDLTKEQRDDMMRIWNQRHGAGRRAVGMLLRGWDWKDLGQTQRDMDFSTGRGDNQERILGAYNVPPFRAGVLDKANYANARQQDVPYYDAIRRYLTRIQGVVNDDFLWKLNIRDVGFAPNWEQIDSKLEDVQAKAQAARQMRELGIPLTLINDRLKLNLDLAGVPGADVAFVPMNMIPAEEAADPANYEPKTVAEEDGEIGGTPAPKNEKYRSSLWKNLWLKIRDQEQVFFKKTRGHFRTLEQEVMANIQGLKGYVATRKQSDDSIDAAILLLFSLEAADRALKRKTAPVYKTTMARGGSAVMVELAIGVNFDMARPDVLAQLSMLTNRVKGVNKTVYDHLKEVLALGIEDGDNVAGLTRRVRTVFSASQSRARTIALTETGMAFNAARHLAMRQVGVPKHEWLSSRDTAVRESHAKEDGSVVRIGDPFPNTGLEYPQDPRGEPEEVINCRCIAVPVIK
jgi:HK97 family phage portal protein